MRSEEFWAPKAQSQVASRKSQVLSLSATALGIWHWALCVLPAQSSVIGHRSLGAGLQPCIAGLKSRPLSIALQRNAPKPFTIHHSPFTIRKHSFRLRFLTPHSSLPIFDEVVGRATARRIVTSLILSDRERK